MLHIWPVPQPDCSQKATQTMVVGLQTVPFPQPAEQLVPAGCGDIMGGAPPAGPQTPDSGRQTCAGLHTASPQGVSQ